MNFGIGWCLIPPQILQDKRLSNLDKLLVGRILGLLGDQGYCFASNDWLGKQFFTCESSISKSLSKLHKLEIVRVEVIKDKNGTERRIYCDGIFAGIVKKDEGDSKNILSGVVKKDEYSNRDISNRDENIYIEKKKIETVSHKGMTDISGALMDSIKAKQVPMKFCATEWQDKAFRYAKDLGIDWNDPQVIKEGAKGRWLGLFKRGGAKIDSAYSFVVDYNKTLSSLEKIKLFFWKFGGGLDSNKVLT